MTRATAAKLLAVLLACTALPAHALSSDRNRPIEIEADQGTLDQGSQSTEFSGNVSIRQGTLFIRAGRVKVVRQGSNQHFTATGSPVRFGQSLDNNKGDVSGQADRVEYRSDTGTVILSGNAHIRRGSDHARGSRITYNTKTETYTISGGSRSRVSIVIHPQEK